MRPFGNDAPLPARWRPMAESDLSDVASIADRVHPAFPEDPAIFAERHHLHPEGCWVLDRDDGPAGYLVSHPWRTGAVPALNALLGRLPPQPDLFYIHDLALLPAARGSGAPRPIVERIARHARDQGLAQMALVAVNGSIPFWRRFGFQVQDGMVPAETLRHYEDSARLMTRSLP